MIKRHSVIIPMFNGANYARAALDSAMAELGCEDEVLVVDNGSTDGSAEMIEAYDDSRVTLLRESKRGPAAARNCGLRHASGEFVSFLDHDDLWPAGRQQGLIAALTADPAANAAYGRIKILFDASPEARLAGLDGQHVPALGLHVYLFRRDLIERAGLFNDEMMFGEDQDYIIRLRNAGMRCAVYDGASAIYRRHADNMTRDRKAMMHGVMDILARNIARKRVSGQPPQTS